MTNERRERVFFHMRSPRCTWDRKGKKSSVKRVKLGGEERRREKRGEYAKNTIISVLV